MHNRKSRTLMLRHLRKPVEHLAPSVEHLQARAAAFFGFALEFEDGNKMATDLTHEATAWFATATLPLGYPTELRERTISL
jgi:hypothetical protein